MASTLTHSLLKKILKEHTVLCVYGVAEGGLYHQLKSWLKQEEHYLIFVEEDEEVFLQAKQLPLAKDPQVRLWFYKEGDQAIFSQIAWEFLFLKMAYVPLFEGRGVDFFKELEHFQNAATLLASDWRDRGEQVLRNLVHNMQFFQSAVCGDSLKDACRGIPAIICGAGPSLSTVAPHFADLKNHALLFAGGTAVNALNAQGILPHLSAYVDPHPPRDRFMAQQNFEIPCFYQNRFSSELLSAYHGQRIWMAGTGNYPIEEWLAASCGISIEEKDTGWTVATFCLHAALHLGCNPIFLAGMDFCCTPDAIYASGVRGEENREQLICLKDDEGNTWHSKRDWLMSGQWISETAAAHPDRTWINLSNGIPIQGIKKCDLSHAASAYLTRAFDIDAHLFSAIQQSKHLHIDQSKIGSITDELKNSFKHCLKYCDQLLTLWQKTFPQSPLATPEYALIEVDMDTEICSQHFLTPLWNMWRHPILRKLDHPLGQHLHRILFYKNALESIIQVLP
jgi:hypothetical protein